MTPLSTSTTTLEFFLYAPDPEKAVRAASKLMKRFYATSKFVAPGYPKPVRFGSMGEILTDAEFQALYRDAQREAAGQSASLRTLGPRNDPTAFHVVREERRIIVAASGIGPPDPQAGRRPPLSRTSANNASGSSSYGFAPQGCPPLSVRHTNLGSEPQVRFQ